MYLFLCTSLVFILIAVRDTYKQNEKNTREEVEEKKTSTADANAFRIELSSFFLLPSFDSCFFCALKPYSRYECANVVCVCKVYRKRNLAVVFVCAKLMSLQRRFIYFRSILLPCCSQCWKWSSTKTRSIRKLVNFHYSPPELIRCMRIYTVLVRS